LADSKIASAPKRNQKQNERKPIIINQMKQNKIQQIMVMIAILSVSCIIFSCVFSSQKDNTTLSDTKEVVTSYDYQIWSFESDKKELRDSTVFYTDTRIYYNRQYHVYALNDSVALDPSYAIEKDSFYLDNVYCPNLDTICLQYENETIELIVSHFDIEKSIDEEMYVYWNHDDGLVALFNYPWNVLILYDKETKKGFAKEVFYEDLRNRVKERNRNIKERIEPQQFCFY
jgi:hypothetical protein